ncbi:MAG TPA: CAP domain-containing protein [Ktedonobacteraceae bacterium]|nr:CAP domain-containing protein [Ktedonobacteraceae bacterium]
MWRTRITFCTTMLIFACLFSSCVVQIKAGPPSPGTPIPARTITPGNRPSASSACVDIPPSPNYLTSIGREQDAVAAINNARQQEHLPPLHLPGNFYTLPPTQQQFIILNAERTDRGLHALQMDANLAQMAQAYSKQMVDLNFFSHTSPISGTFEDRVKSNPAIHGHFTVAENLAGNPFPGAGAMYEYMYRDTVEACGHRHNILLPQLTLVGIGLTVGSKYGTISVQEFLSSTPDNPYTGGTPDTVPPHIAIQKSLQVSSLLCQAMATDNVGVVRITWFVDSIGNNGHVGSSFTLDLRSLSSGQHTILAYAVDGSQNYGMAQVRVTV